MDRDGGPTLRHAPPFLVIRHPTRSKIANVWGTSLMCRPTLRDSGVEEGRDRGLTPTAKTNAALRTLRSPLYLDLPRGAWVPPAEAGSGVVIDA